MYTKKKNSDSQTLKNQSFNYLYVFKDIFEIISLPIR